MIKTTITPEEIDAFWSKYKKIMFRWNFVSAVGLLTLGVVVAFVLKHVFQVKFKFWWLNDTVDGDWGAQWWLDREGLKPGTRSAIRWWFRNHSWNYISKFNPDWKGGSVDIVNGEPELKILYCNVDIKRFKDGIFHWMTREDGIGKISIAYRIHGNVYCRYSEVKKDRFGRLVQIQRGAGGRRYKMERKPMI